MKRSDFHFAKASMKGIDRRLENELNVVSKYLHKIDFGSGFIQEFYFEIISYYFDPIEFFIVTY